MDTDSELFGLVPCLRCGVYIEDMYPEPQVCPLCDDDEDERELGGQG